MRNGRILPLPPRPAAVIRGPLVCASSGLWRTARRPSSTTTHHPPYPPVTFAFGERPEAECEDGPAMRRGRAHLAVDARTPDPPPAHAPRAHTPRSPRWWGTAGGGDLVAAPCAIGACMVAGAGTGSGHRASGRVASHSETASTSSSSLSRKKWPAPGTIRWAECGFPAARTAARRRGAAPSTAG